MNVKKFQKIYKNHIEFLHIRYCTYIVYTKQSHAEIKLFNIS